MNSLFLLAFLILVPGAIVLFLLQPTPTAPQAKNPKKKWTSCIKEAWKEGK